MKKIKVLSCAGILATLLLAGCGETKADTNTENGGNITPVVEEKAPIVFVMSGQSNMEGQTNVGADNAYLKNAFSALEITDGDDCITGIKSVKTSFYGNGYGELNHTDYNRDDVHASNTTDKIKGKFIDTKVGCGHSDTQIGPELGCAYALKEYATEDEPIYFVKMASSGSGFEQSGTQYNWLVKDDTSGARMENNMYDAFLKPFLQNNLDAIQTATGRKPVIRGWLWNQGESDASSAKCAKYAKRLGDLLDAFRTDFASYADDEDGKNIAFIDAMNFEGGTMLAPTNDAKALNEVKKNFADAEDNRYIIDTYANQAKIDDNILKVSGDGSTQGVHYNTKDQFRLGMAYGKVIIDNGLLD